MRCKFCKGEATIESEPHGERHAYMGINKGNILDLYTTHEEEWSDDEYTTGEGEFTINYCPLCGKQLEAPYAAD